MITPLSFAVVVTGIGQCILDEIAATPESGGALKRQCLLVPGAIAADGCDCGQLAQSINRINPTEVFPIDASLKINVACGAASLMATVTATIFRCVPGLNSAGLPPSCNQLRAAALWQAGDEYAMRTAVTCCLNELKRERRIMAFYVGGSDFYGPEGNCGGVVLTYGFQLN
jgi:hypothetical protein